MKLTTKRDEMIDKALDMVNAMIQSGVDFADATSRAAAKCKLSSSEHAELERRYDVACETGLYW